MSTNSNGTAIGNSIPLFLTAKEAKVLDYILSSIGGPTESARGKADSIRKKLIKHYSRWSQADIIIQEDFSGVNRIYFKENKTN
jgi:hypothetical protein